MNSRKLTIKELILTACLCADNYADCDQDTPFKNGFSLPVWAAPLPEDGNRLACEVQVANFDNDPYGWYLVISNGRPGHAVADVIDVSAYISHVLGKKKNEAFDDLVLASIESNGYLNTLVDIDSFDFYINYDEVPSVLSVQVLNEDGSYQETLTEFDLADLGKAVDYAKEHDACVVFVDKRHEYDEDDTNPIIWAKEM